jgi:hypothetical protein
MSKGYGSFPHREYTVNQAVGSTGAAAGNPANLPKPVYTSTLLTNTRVGVSNPGWKEKIRKGSNATTSFTGTRNDLTSDPSVSEHFFVSSGLPPTQANWWRERKYWSHNIDANVPVLPPTSDLTQATNVAQTKFYRALEDAMTLFTGGINLVQLRQTLHMIRNPAQSLRLRIDDYINDIKKYRRGSPIARQNTLSNLYLEHAYGWLPLLGDLDDAAHYLSRRSKQLETEFTKVSGSGTVYKSGFINVSSVSGSITASAELLRRDVSFSRYLGAVSSTASSTKVVNMSSLGLSPRSFVPTLWDWLPWSFVVDYFTNIGDVLTAWANQNVALAWGCQTTRRERKLFSMNYRWTPNVGYTVLFSKSSYAGQSEAVSFEIKRAPITYVPVPSIQFEMPGFGKKWLNLAALALARKSMTPY